MDKTKLFKYRKFDLHLHTYKHKNSYDNKNTVEINDKNIDDFYEKLVENEIDLIAITNHNYFNYDNYILIKKRLENEKNKHKIKVLPGVELSVFYPQKDKNISFHMNMIFNDNQEKQISKEINELYNKGLKTNVNINKILKLLVMIKKKVILIPDVGKASSKIKIKEMDNDFWFYFDFFEGNISFEKWKWHSEFEKLKKKVKIVESKVANSIFGTDNKNYKDYPNNNERKGWTGTFFGIKPTFNSLIISIFFTHLINKLSKDNYPEKDRLNPKFKPNLEDIQDIKIEKYENINIDRGLNVIYGKRGTGKTYFIEKINEYLTEQRINGFKMIKQNEVSLIVNTMQQDKENFISDSNIEKTKNEWNKYIIDEILKITNSLETDKTNTDNYKDIIKDVSNNYREILKNEILNKTFDIEQNIISKINVFFNEFNQTFYDIKEDLSKISKIDLKTEFIKKVFFKNLNWKEASKKIWEEIYKKLKRISFNKSINEIEKKTNSELKTKIKKSFDLFSKIIIKNKDTLKKLNDISEKILSFKFKEKIRLKKIKIFSAKVNFDLNNKEIKKIIEAIATFKKIENINDLFNKKNIFWIARIKKNKSNNLENYIKLTWKYEMDDENIDNLSPGERANKYLNKIFMDTENKILLIDQPEDQLDAESVTESIIEPIIRRYEYIIKKGVQIILVSHDPKIIINTGPTNLIKASKSSHNYKVENVSLENFFIEENNINLIDGKKEYVHKRSQLYGRNKN